MIADGAPRQLDPQVIPFNQVVGWIATAAVSAGILMVMLVLWLTSPFPEWVWIVLGIGWIIATAGLGWRAQAWPEREYAHTSYKVDDDGIEIRTGVYWRRVIVVPRSRVQHIDVTQGPMQRSYGLATLVIFTAGTAHSNVQLPGLGRPTALAIRDALLPKKAADGV